MRKKNILMLLLALAISTGISASNHYKNNRQPLLQKDYIELPLGSIKAEGWMQDQLLRMKNGMTGNLDKIYEKVMGPRNGWLGGDGDVWERGPYWIDGLLPLAYILDDNDLKEKVKPWIEWTLASQKPNGYFGPDTDRPSHRDLPCRHSGVPPSVYPQRADSLLRRKIFPDRLLRLRHRVRSAGV